MTKNKKFAGSSEDLSEFTWDPGVGPDPEALDRIRRFFPRPGEPFGEAWFMGTERRMYTEFLGNLDEISTFDLQKPLEEIASGFSCFGALDEWVKWFHHLLGALIPRAHEQFVDSILEILVTGFIGAYPNEIDPQPYKGFKRDVLVTLGRSIMDKQGWDSSEIKIGRLLHRSNNNPNRVWCWWETSGDLAASCALCLKYLPVTGIRAWIRSVLSIPSPHWRAQIIVWLVGAHGYLRDEKIWPSDFENNDGPRATWSWSHCLRSDMPSNPKAKLIEKPAFIPQANSVAALETLRAELTIENYLEWLESMKRYPYLLEEMEGIPNIFERLYFPQKMH